MIVASDRDFEPDMNRTRNLLIWSQTRYHCATDPDAKPIAQQINNINKYQSSGKVVLYPAKINELINCFLLSLCLEIES